jgi:hypothetical protein
MNPMRRCIFFCLPILCLSYEFSSFQTGFFTGYGREGLSFSYSNPNIANIKAFKNDLKKIDHFPLGLSFQFFEESLVYAQAEIAYGWSWVQQANSSVAVRIASFDQTLSFVLQAPFFNRASGHPLAISTKVGYPFRFGPISILPVLGYSYDTDNLQRSGVSPALFSGADFFASFEPKNGISNRWHSPLSGIYFILVPMAADRIRLSAGYEFHWGRLHSRASYAVDSIVLQSIPERTTINNLKTNLEAKKFAWASIFFLKGDFGVTNEWLISMDLRYRYWKGKKGQAKAKTKGLVTFMGPSFSQLEIEENSPFSFHGAFWQSFALLLQVSYGF